MKSLVSRRAYSCPSVILVVLLGTFVEATLFPLHAAQQVEVEFNIPAQSLASALTEVESQAKVQILFDESLVKGRKAPALMGRFTPQAALNQLLRDTGLIVLSSAPGMFAVERAGQPSTEPNQTTQQQTPTQPQMTLDPVTVLGARGIDVPLSNVPASITVVDQEEIETELATTNRIDDVLARQVPGFNPTNQGVRQIRGRTAQVFINGVPTNEQLRASSGSDLNLLLPEQLAQIEVARGANSAYGFGSPGGIIALSTPRAESEELTFKTRISNSFNPHRIGGSHQAVFYQSASQILGNFDFHVGGAVAYDGAEFEPNGDLALGFNNSALLVNGKELLWSFDSSLGYDLARWGRFRLTTTFNHVDWRKKYETLTAPGVYRERFGTLTKQPRGRDSFRTSYTLNLNYENDNIFGHAVKLEGFTSETDVEFFQTFGAVVRDKQENQYYGFRSSATLPLNRLVTGPFQGAAVTYGFDFIRNDYSRPVFFADTGALQSWISPPVTLISYAPYAQLRIPLGERFQLTGGLRHEIYDGHADTALGTGGIQGGDLDSFGLTLFNAGAVYNLFKDLDLYATFSQGAELSQLGRAARSAGSADRLDLEPAKSNQYELGLRGRWKSLSFSLAGFYTESDLLSALQCDGINPCTPLREPREIWGAESTADWRINQQWSVGTVVSWQDGVREPEGGRRRRIGSGEIPPVLVTSYIGYNPTRWWRNRLQFDYRGRRDKFGDSTEFGEGRVDQLLLLNLLMAFKVGPGELQFGAENLLNKKYTSIAAEAANSGFTWLPEEGTRLKFGYTIKW
ncbi:MAG: TonB-dependent receptor domain-containing protein [Candidatus Binatia bacterium]